MFKFLSYINVLAFLLLCVSTYTCESFPNVPQKLETIYQWNYIDYLWDSNEQKEEYIRNGNYNYANIIPIDVDVAKDGRIFVTAIRNEGVPVSLATVTDQMGPSGPLLRPYPSWSWYNSKDCSGITSVYRVAMDECNKLYVLDTGYIGDNYTCDAQILIFDLSNDQLIDRIKIPYNVSHNKLGVGKLVTPVAEVDGPNCDLENIFMADVNGHGLVIYNKQQRLFRLEANVFEPENQHVRVNIADESFDLNDSLIGLALSPKLLDSRELIFRPFASRAIFAADTRVLARSMYGNRIRYKEGRDMLPSQATAMGMSEKGVLFFGLTSDIAIGCWNVYKDMLSDHVDIAVEDRERLQFSSGLKVIPSARTGRDEEVWALTNRMQKIASGTQNFNEINFRVLKGSVKNLVKNTKCEPFHDVHIGYGIGNVHGK